MCTAAPPRAGAVYRAVVALSIVFYNVFNSSLLYGPAAIRLALAFFNCSVLATAAANPARARRQFAGAAAGGGSIAESARPKGAACIAQLLSGFASKEALSIIYIPCQAEQFAASTLIHARAIAHELKRVRASRERWPVNNRRGH
jgi:hypothetical protein